jgi:uncharacterized phiE125 gp8 family phage protein
MGKVRVVTGPTYEPVTLAEAKLWCRIDDDDTEQDAMVLLLIQAMREYAEQLTGRSFASQTLELSLDSFPDVIQLPHSPVSSVTSITYIDGDGATRTLSGSPSAFQEDLYSEPARLVPLEGQSWPTTSDVLNAVRVRYVTGYTNVTAIPNQLRLWIQTRISTLFEHREQLVVGGQVQALPRDFVDGLLDGLRAKRMFA